MCVNGRRVYIKLLKVLLYNVAIVFLNVTTNKPFETTLNHNFFPDINS